LVFVLRETKTARRCRRAQCAWVLIRCNVRGLVATSVGMDLSEILERNRKRALAAAAELEERFSKRRHQQRRRVSPLAFDMWSPSTESPATHLKHRYKSNWFLDFCMENPLDGHFKKLPALNNMLSSFSGVVQRPTSYCHYDYAYRKRTVFFTSLTAFRPILPCPGHKCGMLLGGDASHSSRVADSTQSQRNSIPLPLLDELLTAWTQKTKTRAEHYLLIDAFAGFGSVRACVERGWPGVRLFCNDIVDRVGVNFTLDLSVDTDQRLQALLVLAVKKFWHHMRMDNGVLQCLSDNKIAVLVHCSTPCETYSTQALAVHRFADGSPRSKQAADADNMNTALVQFFTNAQ